MVLVIWNPGSAVYSHQIERIQHEFLSLAGFKLSIPHSPHHHHYDPVVMLHKLNLQSLDDRRLTHDMSFIPNLLSGKIDSSSLFELINFRLPARSTRNVTPFFILSFLTNYLSNETIIA